jgi:hypothetical protein
VLMLKNFIYAIACIFLVVSCKSKADKAHTDQVKSVDNQTQLLINNLKPIIQGVWVKRDYIEKVIKTQSPIQANDKVIGITTMHFNSAPIDGDSLIARVSYDNHQAGDVILKFEAGKNRSAMPFGENELGYSTQNGDTTLILYQYYNKQWVLTPYVKALKQSAGNDLQEGINYLINKGLIAGTYSFTDSLGKIKDVTFNADGTVAGLLNFKRYFVENSFESKKMNNLDQITFNMFTSEEKPYTFKIDNNTLNLYEIKANADSTLLVRGKLKYQLLRKLSK